MVLQNLFYFAVTFVAVALLVRYIGPLMGRPRTPWRGALIFAFIMAFISWLIGV